MVLFWPGASLVPMNGGQGYRLQLAALRHANVDCQRTLLTQQGCFPPTWPAWCVLGTG